MTFDFTKEPGKTRLNREFNIKGEPFVSIITPYYNSGKYFEQTYNCIMNQTFPWFEWIIVDDGSTNKEDIGILNKLAQTDERIIIFHKDNSGPAGARNYAIEKSKTDIIIFLDADDLIVPTFIEIIYFALKFNPEAAWAYTDSIGFQNQEYMWKKSFDSNKMKTENILTIISAVRKQKLYDVKMFDESDKLAFEDWHLWIKMLSKGYYPVHVGFYGAWYRRTENGIYSSTFIHNEKKDKAIKLIIEESKKINKEIKAKEYPCEGKHGKFARPIKCRWERKIYKNHNKIHIMMLIPWMEMGGADLFNLELAKKINKNNFEIGIITTVQGENTWRQRFEEHVIDIFELPNFLDVENYAEFISYFIISREIDVVMITNSYYGYYLIPWLRKEFPRLAIVDYVHMEEWYWRNGGFARTSSSMGNILERTFVCNERTRQIMINDFGRLPESVETLYIGVDKDIYDATKIKNGIVRKKFGIENNRPVILFPCRIHPQKRPFLMLKIADELRKDIPNIAFMVVGDGPQMEELKQKVSEYELENTVYFAGRQADMRAYYKDSDITLICSLKEGLALTAYESLSMSTPVISSNVGGQVELIDEKVGAILPLLQNEAEDFDKREFAKEEIMQYVSAITKILSDKAKYEQMCIECRKRIELTFSSDIMINKLQNAFEDLLNNNTILKKREKIACSVNNLPGLVDDYISIYNEYEEVRNAGDEVWQAREWYRKLYEEQLAINSINNGKNYQNFSDAKKRLEEIYNMRSWKLIEKYRRVMDNTNIGKVVKKIRNIFIVNYQQKLDNQDIAEIKINKE